MIFFFTIENYSFNFHLHALLVIRARKVFLVPHTKKRSNEIEKNIAGVPVLPLSATTVKRLLVIGPNADEARAGDYAAAGWAGGAPNGEFSFARVC